MKSIKNLLMRGQMISRCIVGLNKKWFYQVRGKRLGQVFPFYSVHNATLILFHYYILRHLVDLVLL